MVPLPPFEQLDTAALGHTPDEVTESLYDMVLQAYESLEANVGSETMRQVERWVMLRTIDSRWIAYLTTMEHLKEAIHLQGYAQKDPLVEYKNEAFLTFDQLKRDIQFEIATNIFRVEISTPPTQPQAPAQVEAAATVPATADPATGATATPRR